MDDTITTSELLVYTILYFQRLTYPTFQVLLACLRLPIQVRLLGLWCNAQSMPQVRNYVVSTGHRTEG